jgi:hypothetical protein
MILKGPDVADPDPPPAVVDGEAVLLEELQAATSETDAAAAMTDMSLLVERIVDTPPSGSPRPLVQDRINAEAARSTDAQVHTLRKFFIQSKWAVD